MKQLFKFIGILFTVLFALGAIVQYNDPDSLLWIIIYGIAALLSALFTWDRLKLFVPIVAGVLCLVGFIFLYPAEFQGFDLNDGDIKTVELGREAFGLLIIGLVMFVYAFRIKRS
jgi:hypothetical protein